MQRPRGPPPRVKSLKSANLRVGLLATSIGVSAVLFSLWSRKKVVERVDFDKPLPGNMLMRGAYTNIVG